MSFVCKLLEVCGIGAQVWLASWVSSWAQWAWGLSDVVPAGGRLVITGWLLVRLLTGLCPGSVAEHCKSARDFAVVADFSRPITCVQTKAGSYPPHKSLRLPRVAREQVLQPELHCGHMGRPGWGRTCILCNSAVPTAITSYAFTVSSEQMSCLESGPVSVSVTRTYQQKSSFLCYRFTKIVVFSVEEFL